MVKAQRKRNLWLEHVRDFKARSPGLSYKEALQKAMQSWKKRGRRERVKTSGKNGWMEFMKDWKKRNPDWKKHYSMGEVMVLCSQEYRKQLDDDNEAEGTFVRYISDHFKSNPKDRERKYIDVIRELRVKFNEEKKKKTVEEEKKDSVKEEPEEEEKSP